MTSSLLLSKIISLGTARDSQHIADAQTIEQRREYRHKSHEQLFMQVVHANDADLIGTTLSCRAVDTSANGLQFCCDRSIPVGCAIDLWIEDNKGPGKFFLSSEVRWIVKESEHRYLVGTELINSAATDIEKWRANKG